MGLEHLPATTTPEEAVALLKRDGAVIIDQVISPGAMDAVAAELKPWLDATPLGRTIFRGAAPSAPAASWRARRSAASW